MRLPALLVLALVPAFAQSFEVASIKPAVFPNSAFFSGYTSGGGACNNVAPKIEGNRVTLQPATICGLIRVAYEIDAHLIGGLPAAMMGTEPGNYWDIVAQTEEGRTLTLEQARIMLQSLLTERFGLKLRRESTERPVYALTVDRGGLKMSTEPMKNCTNGRPPTDGMRGGFGFGSCEPTYTTEHLVESLLRFVDRPLIDRTGLTGKYSFFLRFTIAGVSAPADSAPELPFALQDQLGLRLEASREPVEMLVIEAVHRPSDN